MREKASIVASLLTRSRDLSALLRHRSVYSCCLATKEARRCATRHGSARLGSARRKHRIIYCCVIAEACFDVTVLAWHKYTTILFILDIFSYFCQINFSLILKLPSVTSAFSQSTVPIRSTIEQEIVLGVTCSSIYKTCWNTFYQNGTRYKILHLHRDRLCV
jgi:hypothetical protein